MKKITAKKTRSKMAAISAIIASVMLGCCACSDNTSTITENEETAAQIDTSETASQIVTSETTDDKKDANDIYLQKALTFNQRLLKCQEGYPIVSTYIPDDWRSEVVMYYRISENYPLQAVVALTSPDGKYGVISFSPMSFVDNTQLVDGTRTADDGTHSIMPYATFYHYRDAYDTADLLLSVLGYRWTERDSYPVYSDIVNEYNVNAYNAAVNECQSFKDKMDSSGTAYKLFQLTDSEGTIDRSRGCITDGTYSYYAETITYSRMMDVRMVVDELAILDQVFVFGSETKYWKYDGFSVYWATDEKTFNDNYDKVQFIIANTGTTQAFEAAKQQVLSVVIPMVMEGQQEVSEYAAKTVSEVMGNWNDTNDRVAQMWDDYILDQDRYSTPDGNEITVPTNADYVYYDKTSNSVIWTDSALIEPGPEYQQIK